MKKKSALRIPSLNGVVSSSYGGVSPMGMSPKKLNSKQILKLNTVQMIRGWPAFKNPIARSRLKFIYKLAVDHFYNSLKLAPAISVQCANLPATLVFYMDYRYGGKSATPNGIPTVNLQLSSEPMIAHTYTVKLLDAISKRQNDLRIAKKIGESVAFYIDHIITDDIILGAKHFDSCNLTSLNNTLVNMSQRIFKATMRGFANYLIMHPATYTKCKPQLDLLQSRFKIIESTTVSKNRILMGYRGSSLLDGCYIFAPYQICATNLYLHKGKTNSITSRFSRKLIKPEAFGVLTIT